MAFKENLKSFRLEKKLTQKELANKAEISTTAISYYELGKANPLFMH